MLKRNRQLVDSNGRYGLHCQLCRTKGPKNHKSCVWIKVPFQQHLERLTRGSLSYLNSFDAALMEDERKVIFLIGILSLRSS